jgi:hypothetical protein
MIPTPLVTHAGQICTHFHELITRGAQLGQRIGLLRTTVRRNTCARSAVEIRTSKFRSRSQGFPRFSF